MIIHRIQSENFLKYQKLDINDLPAKGVLAVSGQNESGKTTIGETLCFALFGRTFTLQLKDPKKLIRWGESQCSVSVDFSDKENTVYQIKRYLDDEGAYGARLTREKDGAIIAKGIARVGTELTALIGFGYDEFVESFYLAQRELTTPHPHSHTIKVMAGVAPLAEVASELQGSIADEQTAKRATKVDYNDARKSLKKMGIVKEWFPQLKEARSDLGAQKDKKQGLIDRLAATAEEYRTGVPALKSARWARTLARFLGILFLVAAAIIWAAWGITKYYSETVEAETIQHFMLNQLPAWGQPYQNWLLPLAILFSALVLLEIVLLYKMRGSVARLQEQVARLPAHLDTIRLENQRTSEPFPQEITSLLGDANLDNSDQEAFLSQVKQLETRASTMSAIAEEVTEVEAVITEQMEQEQSVIESQLNTLNAEIITESGRLNEALQLVGIRDNLRSKLDAHKRRIKVRETSSSLLDSAAHHLSHRFNQSILKLAGKALPEFTQNRYQHLKIDENLDVRVFSNEKHDFMGFEEISAGTQRQTMLALRLAMTQELITAIEAGRQFIFFDEPFAFFDQQRIRDTLSALPEFSEEISQIWLVAQEFPDQINVDFHVACSRDENVLVSNSERS